MGIHFQPNTKNVASFFQSLRESHPLKPGDLIDGCEVASTFFQSINGETVECFTFKGDETIYQVEWPTSTSE